MTERKSGRSRRMVRKYLMSLVMVLLFLILLSVNGLPQTEPDCSPAVEGACQRAFGGCLNACGGGDSSCQQPCWYERGLGPEVLLRFVRGDPLPHQPSQRYQHRNHHQRYE